MQTLRCFDIGGTNIAVADVTVNGELHPLDRIPTPTQSFTDFVAALKTHCPANDSAIGVSIAGVIQPQTGVLSSANIPCISGKALASELTTALGRSVYIINDANAFALAESCFGQAKNHAVVLGIILGTGLGGGIVINNQILNGANGTSGEWGHGPVGVTRSGITLPDLKCDCGQHYCLEGYGGATGLEQLFKQIENRSLSSEEIVRLWQQGDEAAAKTIDVWLDIVGGALANIVNFLDPGIVVVGGGLANAKGLIKALDKEVGTRRLAPHESPLLHMAVHGPEQGLLGAAIHVIKNTPALP